MYTLMFEELALDFETIREVIRMTQTPVDKLKTQIELLIQYCESRRALNQRLNIGIGLAGILLGLGATVAGILHTEDARIAAIFGAGSATTQAVLFAYPVGKRERIHRIAVAKLQNLLSDLEIRTDSNVDAEEIKTLLAEFKHLRVKALLEDNVNNESEEPPVSPETIQIVKPSS
jgi:hypothetical protein